MRHLLIYGPPAAGKLTVARSLADRYQMKLLDNHLAFDVAVRVFDFGTAEFSGLVEALRTALFEATAAAGHDSVSTFVFAHPSDRPYVERVEAMAARCGVELGRVLLRPPPDTLYERVMSGSRQTGNKIRDEDTLREVLGRYDLYTPIDKTDLIIDNSAVTPDEVVDTIAAHFRL